MAAIVDKQIVGYVSSFTAVDNFTLVIVAAYGLVITGIL